MFDLVGLHHDSTGLQMYGRAWRTISKCVVKTRTPEQVRIHAQKYFHKQAQKAKNKRKPLPRFLLSAS